MQSMGPLRRHVWPLLLVIAVLPAILSAQAGRVLNGRVVDAQTGTPIPGAVVTLVGVHGTVRTDADGRFTWDHPPAPPFQIIVVLPGGQVARPIEIRSFGDAVTPIAVDPVAEESVTVIGAAPSVSAAPAAATSLLSSSQISRRTPENLMQALETVPGVSSVSEGHASVPAIRGLARGRTLVLIDGARVTSERRVGPSATYADPATFEGIDVARGPGSVAYGSDALGGVVSVRTRRAAPGSPLAIRGSGTLGAGVPEWRATAEVSRGFRRGGALLQAHGRAADDWRSPVGEGAVFNSGWSDRGFNGRVDYEIGPGVLSAGWQSDFGRDIERPRNNSRAVRFFYPFEDSHRLTSSYEVANRGGFQVLSVTGFVGAFDQRTDQDRFATATTPRHIERADVSAKDFHAKGSGVRTIGRTRLEAGIDVNGRFGLEAADVIVTYDLAGVRVGESRVGTVDAARRTNTGAYFQLEAPLWTALRVAAGARGDHVSTRNTGGYFGNRQTSNGAFSGFTALTAGPLNGLSLTAQVSRGFRDPTLSDRYFRGVTGRGFITGNPDLTPETSLQLDIGARYTRGRTQVAAYVYHYRIDDLVERYTTAPDFFFFRNEGRARIRGFEAEARTDLGAGIALEGGFNISRGRAPGTGSNLDDIAPDIAFAIVRKDFGDTGFAQLRTSLSARDDRPGPSEVNAPGAQVIDVAGGWRVTKALDLRGIVRNLLNDAYYASPDPRWVYAPGRSGSLTLSVQF